MAGGAAGDERLWALLLPGWLARAAGSGRLLPHELVDLQGRRVVQVGPLAQELEQL
jgi:hypothetical protein